MDANTINELNRKRFSYLQHLYEVTQGERHAIVSLFEVGEEIGIDREDAYRVADFLAGEGLLKHMTLGGGVSITHQGAVQVETALANPDRPTDYFPPVNLIFVGSMTHSQIQQGAVASIQSLQPSEDYSRQMREFLERLKSDLPDLPASEEVRAELAAEIATLEAQQQSPRPKITIVKEALSSVRTILEGMAGSALATGLLQLLGNLL